MSNRWPLCQTGDRYVKQVDRYVKQVDRHVKQVDRYVKQIDRYVKQIGPLCQTGWSLCQTGWLLCQTGWLLMSMGNNGNMYTFIYMYMHYVDAWLTIGINMSTKWCVHGHRHTHTHTHTHKVYMVTCQGLFQSRGIGTAPSHAPNRVDMNIMHRPLSAEFTNLCVRECVCVCVCVCVCGVRGVCVCTCVMCTLIGQTVHVRPTRWATFIPNI